jgi:hypothetical protein
MSTRHSKFLIVKNDKIVANKKADIRTIQFANLLNETLSVIQSEIDETKRQYEATGIKIPNTSPKYKPGVQELAVLFDHRKLSDDYGFETFKTLFSKMKKGDCRNCLFWEGMLPFGKDYLFSVALQTKNNKELDRFCEITGGDSSIKGLMPINQRWIYAPKKNSFVSLCGMTEVLEINNGVVGDLKAEKSGYEVGRLQELLKGNGWECRKLNPPV